MPERKHQHKRVAGVEEKEPLPQKLSRKNKHIAEGKGKEERIAKKISQKHKRAAMMRKSSFARKLRVLSTNLYNNYSAT